MRLLIDECLSPELVGIAKESGYPDTTHVTWLGLQGAKDWELMPVIVSQDWTFVTKNSRDFRGPEEDIGNKGLYAFEEIHAGLICLNGPVGLDLDMQCELFKIALDEIKLLVLTGEDLINRALEVTLHENDEIEISVYEIPKL